ncbi:MAG: hypothetical protein ACKOPE_02085 [Novosphingobium sp.]
MRNANPHLTAAAERDAAQAALPSEAPRPNHWQFGESTDLEVPGWIWGIMIAYYGVFFAGLMLAAGHDAEAMFFLVISSGFAVMYFGTVRVLLGLRPVKEPSRFARGLEPLYTWTGPMNTGAVAAQILTVPLCLAFFGLAAAVIRAIIF